MPILLFDGYCNLCTSSVQFVIRKEKQPRIQFASLQSKAGINLLAHHHINANEVDSLVLIENNRAYIKSSAALRISKYLKGIYPLSVFLLIIPAFIRNAVYDYVAKNRYRWFGKTENCMVPTPELKQRFLD